MAQSRACVSSIGERSGVPMTKCRRSLLIVKKVNGGAEMSAEMVIGRMLLCVVVLAASVMAAENTQPSCEEATRVLG